MNNPVDLTQHATLIELHNKNPQQHRAWSYWWICHLRAFLFACGELIRNPFSTLMTLLVIGITFSLPVTFFALLQNLANINTQWSIAPKITLYLKQGLSMNEVNTLLQELNQNKHIEATHYISPQEGLASLENEGHLTTDTLQALGSNPLPSVIEITPDHLHRTPQQMQDLYTELQQLTSIELVQLNLDWVKRLYYLFETLKYLTLGITILFGAGLILIVGNTIRLDMKSNQEEIDILRLIGANRSFIRRPLLYRGALYGSIGGLMAWLLSSLFLWWMETPAAHLAMSYNTLVTLHGLHIIQGCGVILVGGLLSTLGARLVVAYALRQERSIV